MLTLTKTEKLLFNRLVHLAQLGRLTSYSEEAVRLNPPMLARHPVYCKMLDRINRYSYEHYGVFLAAIVKHKSSDTVGLGFFVVLYFKKTYRKDYQILFIYKIYCYCYHVVVSILKNL